MFYYTQCTVNHLQCVKTFDVKNYYVLHIPSVTVALFKQYQERMLCNILFFYVSDSTICSHYLTNDTIFSKDVIENIYIFLKFVYKLVRKLFSL